MPTNHEMHYLLQNQVLVYNLKIQARKYLMIYNTTNGITTLKKHVNANHYIIAKMFEEEINNQLKWEVRKQPIEKIKSNTYNSVIVNFLLPNNLSKRIICNKKCFLKIWACWLLKIICPCNLLKVIGWNAYVCICVQDWSFLLKDSFHKKCSLN